MKKENEIGPQIRISSLKATETKQEEEQQQQKRILKMPNPTTRQEIMKMTHPMGPLRNRKVYADFINLIRNVNSVTNVKFT